MEVLRVRVTGSRFGLQADYLAVDSPAPPASNAASLPGLPRDSRVFIAMGIRRDPERSGVAATRGSRRPGSIEVPESSQEYRDCKFLPANETTNASARYEYEFHKNRAAARQFARECSQSGLIRYGIYELSYRRTYVSYRAKHS